MDTFLGVRRRMLTVGLMLAGGYFGYHAVFGQNGLTVYQQKRAEDRQLQQQIEQLQSENTRLKTHVEQLKSDPDAIEHEARERLHYARPGEVIYTLNQRQDTPR